MDINKYSSNHSSNDCASETVAKKTEVRPHHISELAGKMDNVSKNMIKVTEELVRLGNIELKIKEMIDYLEEAIAVLEILAKDPAKVIGSKPVGGKMVEQIISSRLKTQIDSLANLRKVLQLCVADGSTLSQPDAKKVDTSGIAPYLIDILDGTANSGNIWNNIAGYTPIRK